MSKMTKISPAFGGQALLIGTIRAGAARRHGAKVHRAVSTGAATQQGILYVLDIYIYIYIYMYTYREYIYIYYYNIYIIIYTMNLS